VSFTSSPRSDVPLLRARWTYGTEARNLDTDCTIVLEIDGLPMRALRTEIVPVDADGRPIAPHSGGGHTASVVWRLFPVPTDRIDAVRVRLSAKTDDSRSGSVVEKRLH
jgi:hypothetical protein